MTITSPPADDGPWLVRMVRRTRSDRGLRREAEMMGLYVSLTLLAVLLTGNDLEEHTKLDVLLLVWSTTIGLAIAHWFALVLSVRLVRDPDVHHSAGEMLLSQLLMSVLLAVSASVVVLVLPDRLDRLGARLTAASFIAVIVYVESRVSGRPARQSVLLGLGVLAIAYTIAFVKWYLSY
jgi:hypothetical protein